MTSRSTKRAARRARKRMQAVLVSVWGGPHLTDWRNEKRAYPEPFTPDVDDATDPVGGA